MKHHLTILITLIFSSVLCWAKVDSSLLNTLKSGEPSQEQWVEAIAGLQNVEMRAAIEKAINSRKKFPKKQLVKLLSHPKLAVRLGAIEMLEDATGGDNGFNPWLPPQSSNSNADAIKQWQQWAASNAKILDKKLAKLSPEKIQGYIQQILSNDRDRVSRAIRMLEGDNFHAVATIQQFLVDNPSLPEVKRNQLKQAQYELVLIKTSRTNAQHLAHDLVIGNRDQKISALANLKRLGLITIPIIREFIDAPDALIRETALDAILSVGGAQTLPFVSERLKQEKDINVIHAAIRRIKNIGGQQALAIVSSFLDHPDEDLVISSISGVATILSGAEDSHGQKLTKGTKSNDALIKKITSLLKDNRWRVRVQALSFVKKIKLKSAADQILYLLKHDSDEFVRHNAIDTAVSLEIKDALPILHDLYLKHDEMIPSLTSAFVSMKGTLPEELLKHLKSRDPDTIISSLRAFNSSKKENLSNLIYFAKVDDIDISCAALRLLANSESKTKKPLIANTLTDVIKSNNEDKINAIVNSLELPDNNKTDPRLRYLKNPPKYTSRSGKTKLDPLYDAFIRPGGKMLIPDGSLTTSGPTSSGGVKGLISSLIELAKKQPSSERSFQIALLLTKAGDPHGLELIKDNIAKMPISKRAALVKSLYKPRTPDATSILLTLLQDPSAEIRKTAIRNAFRNKSNLVLIQQALDSIASKNSRIKGADAYNYGTENLATNKSTRAIFHAWAIEQLTKNDANDEIRILSLILIRKIATDADNKIISSYTSSPNPWLRRAAWHTLGIYKSSWLQDNLSKLEKEPHPDVRAALPDAFCRADTAWNYIFNDVSSRTEESYYPRKSRRTMTPAVENALQRMAKNDPSATNRFEANFCLLSHAKTIDLAQFIALIPKQPKSSNVTKRLSDLVEENYQNMGKGMRPLLAYIDFKYIYSGYRSKILAHFAQEGSEKAKQDTGFTTFAGLAKSSKIGAAPQHIKPKKTTKKAPPRKKLTVVFFEKAGCKKCQQVSSYLDDLKQEFPLMQIKRQYVDQNEGILLNNHLSGKFQVPSTQVLKAPAVFTSSGFLIGSKINPKDLSKLLSRTMDTPEQPDWFIIKTEQERKIAETKVEEKFRDLTLPIVIIGGLLDGINPCAFATIIFFLSYLTIAKRSAKEIFFVGVSFILAVFLAYLSFGLIFNKLLKYLTENSEYQWIRNSLNYVFAAFALIIAILSLRDWWRARQGRIGDMTLQLPGFLKKKIRSVIREHSRSSLYILAAFLSGIIISVLELACTGQVYAPIIYQINKGNQDATTMLVIYNLAFVLPLIIIFGLAMTGMKSNALINFQKNHTATIKFLTALLFFLLAAVLLFSGKISLWIEQFYPHIS